MVASGHTPGSQDDRLLSVAKQLANFAFTQPYGSMQRRWAPPHSVGHRDCQEHAVHYTHLLP
ncbi:hypothetical protein EYR41_001912 [Orbilia oligospora]|uniref:Uncharacterized protein n=1 Tax=Orbilia oligospora TaxID=2813651 RepID=A0A7C8PEY6_ORBOL|nr:hypothetical protein TWF751_006878 [Orbilia oligospora]TGJ74960.1 hypothetical protein EYR41_001912 [Orbilia oligospora]